MTNSGGHGHVGREEHGRGSRRRWRCSPSLLSVTIKGADECGGENVAEEHGGDSGSLVGYRECVAEEHE